ncbi:hypothetical protein NDU88_000749 [Pleurodeles waltl]|uniref:Uncharacterized protein n=1 Tax=Pleurodeles waltl TaxID=8319 RepID=A0AAV7S7V5_PLEWA|nr:hypothetical protein NDU88_000749 [Pleurodeles waltl]
MYRAAALARCQSRATQRPLLGPTSDQCCLRACPGPRKGSSFPDRCKPPLSTAIHGIGPPLGKECKECFLDYHERASALATKCSGNRKIHVSPALTGSLRPAVYMIILPANELQWQLESALGGNWADTRKQKPLRDPASCAGSILNVDLGAFGLQISTPCGPTAGLPYARMGAAGAVTYYSRPKAMWV